MNYRPFHFMNQVLESISIEDQFPIYCFYKSNITNVHLGINIEMIPPLCFEYSTVEFINLENIRVVSSEAFSNCEKLINVTFSDKLEYIGPYAFNRCYNLESISISSNNKIGIGVYAFSDCHKLDFTIFLKDVSITAINQIKSKYLLPAR